MLLKDIHREKFHPRIRSLQGVRSGSHRFWVSKDGIFSSLKDPIACSNRSLSFAMLRLILLHRRKASALSAAVCAMHKSAIAQSN